MIRPLNGNVVIRYKKNANELVTASGIVLPLVEQDVNIAEVVAVPDCKKYETIERQHDGTPIRNDDGSLISVFRYIEVVPGDKVVMEKRFHHEYDFTRRDRIDRTIFLKEVTEQKNDEYDYYITSNDDILLTVPDEGLVIGDGNVYGELYTQVAPKQVKRSYAS